MRKAWSCPTWCCEFGGVLEGRFVGFVRLKGASAECSAYEARRQGCPAWKARRKRVGRFVRAREARRQSCPAWKVRPGNTRLQICPAWKARRSICPARRPSSSAYEARRQGCPAWKTRRKAPADLSGLGASAELSGRRCGVESRACRFVQRKASVDLSGLEGASAVSGLEGASAVSGSVGSAGRLSGLEGAAAELSA